MDIITLGAGYDDLSCSVGDSLFANLDEDFVLRYFGAGLIELVSRSKKTLRSDPRADRGADFAAFSLGAHRHARSFPNLGLDSFRLRSEVVT